jgi:hypothetical protein
MHIKKFLLLSTGLITILALLVAVNAFAQFDQCASYTLDKKGDPVPGNFTVTVNQTAENGRRTYTYNVSGDNMNKFFVWVAHDLDSEEGFSATCDSSPDCQGTYLEPFMSTGGFPPDEAWNFTLHQDGVGYTSVNVNNNLVIDVKDRFRPEKSLTTVLVGLNNETEWCGPIYGPTGPSADVFEGSPISGNVVADITAESGCKYKFTAGVTTNIITHVAVHPDSPPYELYGCGGTGQPACKPCEVTYSPGICERDLGIPFCPPTELGRPPLKGEEGGTCYCGPYKFPC